ncbi:flagellar protein FlgN [Paenibacillus physcomitrellae]|uniref:Flagellar biosynthesis protein FlgN n=1 Tax=Paenibacillus physcomitrellae TaxID=1619311 RepID=A0ABQ1GGZ2_9BACL|nr:flagellar protein FlgN [Paenibacillus physcomitrellae]GGA43712.1 hypothetical protein GCM10010917_31260 [Paenibacillus physcomitrellae]
MSVEALVGVLERLDEEHRTMLNWADEKRKAIIDNQVDKLIGILNQESRCMKRIGQLDEERMEACQSFLRERGIKSRLDLNMTEISRLVFDPADKQRLQEIQTRLSQTLNRLKEANDLNQKLVEQSLSFIDYSLDLLVGAPEDETTYHHPVHKAGGYTRTGFFDARG